MALEQIVALTLVAAERQGEEQENTSYLHSQGDALLGTAKRKRDTSQTFRDAVSGGLCWHLYAFPHLWHHATWPAAPCSLVVITLKSRGQYQVANGSLVCARMKASQKPMEVRILIAGKDWSCISGVGDSLGSALQAGKE